MIRKRRNKCDLHHRFLLFVDIKSEKVYIMNALMPRFSLCSCGSIHGAFLNSGPVTRCFFFIPGFCAVTVPIRWPRYLLHPVQLSFPGGACRRGLQLFLSSAHQISIDVPSAIKNSINKNAAQSLERLQVYIRQHLADMRFICCVQRVP